MRYLALGAIDGILTASTLSATLLLRGATLSIDLILSISIVVATVNALTVFVAELSHQLHEIEEISYKISLREGSRWTLLHTRLLFATLRSTLGNFVASFAGAFAVLIPSYLYPYAFLPAVVVSIAVTSLVLAGGLGRRFLEFSLLIGVAVAVGLAIGLTFPIIA
ncbi:hypothetical protein Pogu_2398 [Pyrobaculum oguniense TE7]|uniref:VIT family protein n=1 Tax=Pyrobaculum oguniense (strain DSM 13380 / JCM 10595 / TE7) TaxID=698757 RepID=H6QD82_PYROT|nr:hypothetical protein Pogu_2398 [Pyrobaculum oguniense TE7]